MAADGATVYNCYKVCDTRNNLTINGFFLKSMCCSLINKQRLALVNFCAIRVIKHVGIFCYRKIIKFGVVIITLSLIIWQ